MGGRLAAPERTLVLHPEGPARLTIGRLAQDLRDQPVERPDAGSSDLTGYLRGAQTGERHPRVAGSSHAIAVI